MGVSSSVSGVKAGTVAWFGASAAPAGWIKANGATISRSTYAALFLALGDTYGAGDGSTTFAVPDLRGEFIRGLDDGRGVDSARGIGTAQGQSVEQLGAQFDGSWRRGAMVTVPSWNAVDTLAAGGVGDTSARTDALKVDSTGTGVTRPRNVALLACIKY